MKKTEFIVNPYGEKREYQSKGSGCKCNCNQQSGGCQVGK